MKIKYLASGAAIVALSISPLSPMPQPARADSGDVVAGLIVGAIIGGAVASEKGKKKSKAKSKSSKSKSKAPAISAEQKAENVEVQQALNHFGWNVGTADGALGAKSKAAVKEYQAFMGYPVTGDLTGQERSVLVTAYHRAQAGGSVISEIVSGSVYGLRGVLIAQAQEMAPAAGGTMAAAGPIAPEPGVRPGDVAAAAAAAIPALLPEGNTVAGPAAPIMPSAPVAVDPVIPAVPVVTPVTAPVVAPEAGKPAPIPLPAAPSAPVAAVEPEPAAPAIEPPAVEETAAVDASGPGLPTFLGAGDKDTLSAACNAVAMQTAVNGAPVAGVTAENAGLALDEQFCLARTEAVATGDALAAQVQGVTPEEIARQCDALAPVLKDHVAALSAKPADEVIAGVEGFVLASGMSPEQLSGTAQVCLGAGYKADNASVAIGSALLLTAMGKTGYAELLGFHLARGQGAEARPDLAEGWYELAAGAAEAGDAVFAGGDAGRASMLLDAAYALNGHGPATEPALPSFVLAPAAEPAAEPVVAPPAAAEAATTPAPLPAAPGEAVAMRAEGPGADALRMGAEFARVALTAPFMAMAE